MRGICRLLLPLLPLLALVPPVHAGIAVRESQGKIDVAAAAAPLADVLDRLARQTGMKVVYEGPAPRQLVTLSLVGRSPAEAVTAILEGQGLNYALILDATATRVEKLLVTGAATSGGSGPSSARTAPAAPFRRMAPPDNDPEPDEPPEEIPPVPEVQPPPPSPDKPVPPPPAASATGPPLPPGMVTAPPGLSPFNPRPLAFPTPLQPQPTPTPTPEPAAPP
jgi:hypothetical protein